MLIHKTAYLFVFFRLKISLHEVELTLQQCGDTNSLTGPGLPYRESTIYIFLVWFGGERTVFIRSAPPRMLSGRVDSNELRYGTVDRPFSFNNLYLRVRLLWLFFFELFHFLISRCMICDNISTQLGF